ncbi:MAG: hypothetical protein LAT82_01295 [Nanoarchaeota archaeon]|nr:hypothetical protein [Nanoarchaeota archaeon]
MVENNSLEKNKSSNLVEKESQTTNDIGETESQEKTSLVKNDSTNSSQEEKKIDENTDKESDNNVSDKTTKVEEEVDPHEESFSHEEMQALEEQEKGFFSKIASKFSKKEDNKDEDDNKDSFEILNQKEISRAISKLQNQNQNQSIEFDKIVGKFEVLNQKESEISEHLQESNEKIGELRSTVLGRERMFNKLEDDFNSVKYIVNTFKPENIDKRFDELNKQFAKLSSGVERTDTKTKQMEDKLAKYSVLMEKIKNYESLLFQLDKIKSTEKHISDMKLTIEKYMSKIEIMSLNISDSTSMIKSTNQLAYDNQESIKDLIKSLSKLEAKSDILVKQENFNFLKEDVEVIKKVLFDSEFKKAKKLVTNEVYLQNSNSQLNEESSRDSNQNKNINTNLNNDKTKKVIEYITSHKEEFSKEQIKKSLLKANIDEELIDTCFKEVFSK